MRVTGNTFSAGLIDQLNKLVDRQSRLQNQVATGQRIQYPEDDPAAVNRVLAAQSESKALSQYQRNIDNLHDLATASYSAIKGIKNVSDRAGEIAVSGDGTKSAADLKSLANEVTLMIQQAAQLANSQNQGDYLFAGTATGNPPFKVNTDANGWVTSVTYQGNDQTTESEISQNNLVAGKVPGQNASGTGTQGLLADSRTGADLFKHLIDLQNHLRDGDTNAIANTDRANLAKDEDNLIYHYSANGALQAQLEATSKIITDRKLDLTEAVSRDADADLATTITHLNQTQVAYQAALQTGSMLLNNSLLNYLR
jgi:flagellar hook-associated protein 3 FlgL